MSKRFALAAALLAFAGLLPICGMPSQAPVTEATIVAQASIGRPRKWCFLAYTLESNEGILLSVFHLTYLGGSETDE
ncbi:MAG: hypothetical protein WA428_06120 [Candidatus Cybelea sp.]